jgi:hypothetical protein
MLCTSLQPPAVSTHDGFRLVEASKERGHACFSEREAPLAARSGPTLESLHELCASASALRASQNPQAPESRTALRVATLWSKRSGLGCGKTQGGFQSVEKGGRRD